MRQRLSRLSVVLASVVAIIAGISTLIGLILGDFSISLDLFRSAVPSLPETIELPTSFIAQIFIQIAVTTVAMTIFIGFLNLLLVNSTRLYRGRTITARLNSFVIIVTFIATLVLYVVDRERSMFLLEDVQVTIESALASLLFFTLVYGAFRFLRVEVSPERVLFSVTVLVVLLGALPLPILAPVHLFTQWLLSVPVNAGASGILLGIALATVLTGLRILIGQDRSYGE